jgi:hypothetical protein
MMNASGCRFGDGADDRSLFFNRKSQLYWEFREGLRTGKLAIGSASKFRFEVETQWHVEDWKVGD